jgi:TldD protein
MKFLIPLCLLASAASAQDDVILRAMRDELTRSLTLKLANLESPYYIEYELDDVKQYTATASLGGLLGSSDGRFRVPRVHVRVGNYDFDNTNYVGSGFNFGTRYDVRLPLDNSYPVLRQSLWLATDQSYKSALEAISRKRAALRNISVAEKLPDFTKATAVQHVEPISTGSLNLDTWLARTRAVSGVFRDYPKLKTSSAEFSALDGTHYFISSEGTQVRQHSDLGVVRLRASAQAADGMLLRDAAVFQSLDHARLPGEAEMERAARSMADNLSKLVQAPVGENYSGPVLFEGVAGPQIFAEVLGKNLSLSRKPVLEPGSPGSVPSSELEGRQGARVLPDTFQIVDDPTQTEYQGHKLFGSFTVDDEGVQPQPLTIIEKGVLKNFVLTRQPVRGFGASNGRARLPGSFGARTAAISNLFVQASETSTVPQLKQKLIDACKQRGKPYGIVVRKMDFPSSASLDEARRLLSGAGQGAAHAVSLPVLIYRVYLDGHEELVRGLHFRGLNVRSLKDIMAAGNDANALDYLENGFPFALMGAGSEAAEVTVIAPSILVDDLELLPLEDELPKLPIVPPPASSR